MAQIRDELILDVDRALRAVRRLQTSIDSATKNVDFRVNERPFDRLDVKLGDIRRSAGRVADQVDAVAVAAGRSEANFTDVSRELGVSKSRAEGLSVEMSRTNAATSRTEEATRQVKRQLGLSDDEARRLASSMSRAASETKEAKRNASGLRSALGKVRGLMMGIMGVVAGSMAIRASVKKVGTAIQAYSALVESVNAVTVVFGEASKQIFEFADVALDKAALSAETFNTQATLLGSAMLNAGFSADDAAARIVAMTQRAADTGSVLDVDLIPILQALRSAFRGMMRPISEYTGGISIAQVKSRALEMGLIGTGDELTNNARILGVLSLFFERTARFAGDLANTQGSIANRTRRAKEASEELAAVFGGELESAAQRVFDVFGELLPVIEGMAPQVGILAENFVDLVDALDQTAKGGGGIAQWVAATSNSFGMLGDVGGGVVDMFQFVADTISALPMKLWTGDLKDFGSTFNKAGAQVDSFAQRIDNMYRRIAAQGITATVSKGGDAIRAFAESLVYLSQRDTLGTGNKIAESFDLLASAAGLSAAEEQQAVLWLLANRDAANLTATEVTFLTSVVGDLSDEFQRQSDTLNGTVPTMTGVSTLAGDMATRFANLVPSVGEASDAMGIFETRTAGARAELTTSIDVINGAPDKIKVSMKQFLENVTASVQQRTDFEAALAALAFRGFGALKDKLAELGPGAKDLAVKFLNNLDLAAAADTALRGQGVEVSEKIVALLNDAARGTDLDTASIGLVRSLADGMTTPGALSAVEDSTFTILKTIANVAESGLDFGEIGYTWATATALGFAAGFDDPATYAMLQHVGATIDRAVREGLQISSPSRVFEKIGEYAAQGLIQGFARTISQPSTMTAGDVNVQVHVTGETRDLDTSVSRAVQTEIGRASCRERV